MFSKLWQIVPGHLTNPPTPRHLAETTERTRRLEFAAKVYGDARPRGRHSAGVRFTDAQQLALSGVRSTGDVR